MPARPNCLLSVRAGSGGRPLSIQPAAGSAVGAHRPVLLAEALAGLAVRVPASRPRIFVDATYGRGGHSRAIADAMAVRDTLHALDRDPQACEHARRMFGERKLGEHKVGEHRGFHVHHRNFAELAIWADERQLQGRVDGLLLDLGVSSPQLDDPARGFSFTADGPLDMRMDPGCGVPASEWLASESEAGIADVLWRFGEERNSRRIARRIVETRAGTAIATTAQLASLIAAVPGPRSRKIHPATRSFQAIRIHVNGELDALASALASARRLLAPGGRLALISFHSLEDRVVKRFLRDASATARGGQALAPWLGRPQRVFPSAAEVAANPRARSAVLRFAERLPGGQAGG